MSTKYWIGMGGVVAAALLAISAAFAAGEEDSREGLPRTVLGTFDSRALCVSYVRSDRHALVLKALHAEHQAAKANGDSEQVAELEARGQAMQDRTHRQTFCAAPVPDIIALLEDRLPELAKEAGVEAIVSQWELAYRAPAAKTVDVTMLLVNEFDPDEATLEVIEQLKDHEPLPLEALEGHDH